VGHRPRGRRRDLLRGRRHGFSLLFLLLGGSDDDLVDGDPAGSCDDVRHGVCYIFWLQALDAGPSVASSLDVCSHVAAKLGLCRTGLDHGDAYVPAGDLLAQGLAERTDAVLVRL